MGYLKMTTFSSDLQRTEEKHSWSQLELTPTTFPQCHRFPGLEVAPTQPPPLLCIQQGQVPSQWLTEIFFPLSLLMRTDLAFNKTLFIQGLRVHKKQPRRRAGPPPPCQNDSGCAPTSCNNSQATEAKRCSSRGLWGLPWPPYACLGIIFLKPLPGWEQEAMKAKSHVMLALSFRFFISNLFAFNV